MNDLMKTYYKFHTERKGTGDCPHCKAKKVKAGYTFFVKWHKLLPYAEVRQCDKCGGQSIHSVDGGLISRGEINYNKE